MWFKRGPWANPDFVRLWAGQTVSIFGTLAGGIALQLTAVAWLDAGAAAVALLAVCQLVPGFVLGLVAGVWVDRLRRRPVLIAADLGRFAALATIPVAALFDALTLGHLFAVAAVESALAVFFATAYGAYLPSLVSRKQIVDANSAMTASASAVEVGAFSASGWLVQLLTAPGAVAVDALSFLWSALWLARIKTPEPPPKPPEGRRSAWQEAVEGLRVVARHPILRTLAIFESLHAFAGRIISVVLLLYLVDEVGFEPGVLGMIFAVGGLTSLFGAWLAARAGHGDRLGTWLVGAAWVRVAGAIFMPLTVSVSPAGYGYLVAGQVVTDPAWTFGEIYETSLRQSVTPDHLLGRVRATSRFVSFAAMLLGTAAAAIIGETVGLRPALFTSVAVMALAALVLTLSPVGRLRNASGDPDDRDALDGAEAAEATA